MAKNTNGEDHQIIFSMVNVSKTIQQTQKTILKNIYLSFYYGAKIAIVGANGAGKSTLMKIIAGIDTQLQGQVVFSRNEYSVGYLEQDPKLDPNKTVLAKNLQNLQVRMQALDEEIEKLKFHLKRDKYY